MLPLWHNLLVSAKAAKTAALYRSLYSTGFPSVSISLCRLSFKFDDSKFLVKLIQLFVVTSTYPQPKVSEIMDIMLKIYDSLMAKNAAFTVGEIH